MKTKGYIKKDKVNIITLGCSKNIVDSELLLTQLKASDINAVHESEEGEANIVIINTCGFIDKAKQESIDTILTYIELKKKGKIEKLYVTGCLSERYREELIEELPEVDGFFGTMDMPALLARFNADYKNHLVGERLPSTPLHYAYLKISEGCNRPCSFCAIPLMRGKHRSRPIESLVEEARFLANRGVKELILIAQDLTYYGLDLYQERKLATLLRALNEIEGIGWIRLHYAFPSGFPLDVLEAMLECEKVCHYLDIPLQHISDKILKAMRRGITQIKTQELIDKIRDKIPRIALRTTMLVGFPGETDRDFQELLEFVEKNRFERLGVFTYSHEEGTYAYQWEDNVPFEVKEQRAEQLMLLQQDISYELNQEKVGQIVKVIIDRKEGEYWIGRTEYDSPEVDNEVLISSNLQLKVGEFYEVSVHEASEYDLIGTLVNEPNYSKV
ncbi:MAG: 30S ribosomal protein S12 methylthiotransferase RimO [Bacteroidia bacterium]|nr:30S ribosomal protein S12 methylthiotransferase RimO [Bacteroidia bacterium]